MTVKGTVKWFSRDKGYGFITSQDDGHEGDLYFHVKDIQGATLPNNGDSVEFDVVTAQKGSKAVRVVIVQRQQRISKARPERVDDRIACPGCGRRIVPRLITNRGEPSHSVCPYCATTVRSFTSQNNLGIILVGAFIVLAFLGAVFGK